MTNSSLSSVLNLAVTASLAAALSGCGDSSPKTLTVDDYVDEAAAKLAVADIDAARIAISNAYELASGDVDVRLLKAQIDFYQRDNASAAELYRGIAEDTSLDRKIRSQGWAGLGVIAQFNNNSHEARVDFLKARRLDGKNPSVWYHLGYLYYNDFGFYSAASDCYETFVRLETVADERVQKVQRTVIPQLREARTNEILEIPGARNPDRAGCAKALQAAETAVKKSNFKTAVARYGDALKADPTSAPAALGLARMIAKTDKTAQGRQRALEYYRRACKLSPNSISTFIAAADFAVSMDSHLTAGDLYSRAIAADPTNITAIDGLIRALRKANQPKAANLYQKYREFLAVKVK